MLRDVGAGLRDIYLLISDVFSGGEVFFCVESEFDSPDVNCLSYCKFIYDYI